MRDSSGDRSAGPLEGITVIDLSWHLAGPFCTLILADLGARVIKVEAPGSHGGYDPGGFIRHFYKGQDAHYMALNRNKLSVTLNLKAPEGIELFKRLCTTADVVFNNFRPGVMNRLGIGYEEIRRVAPDVVFASLSSFGQDGPYSTRPGVDLVVQALSGGMSLTSEPGRPPVRAGIPVGDLAGGMWAVIAILAALRGRRHGIAGDGEIDVALLDGQIALTAGLAGQYFLDGSLPGAGHLGATSEAAQAFKCADERYVVLDADDDVLGQLLSGEGGTEVESLIAQPNDGTVGGGRRDMTQLVERIFRGRPSDHWEQRLQRLGVPHARVNRLDEALTDVQVIERGMIIELEHRLGGRLRFVGCPIRLPGFRMPIESPPLQGEHTEQILGDLGLSVTEVGRLRADGVVS